MGVMFFGLIYEYIPILHNNVVKFYIAAIFIFAGIASFCFEILVPLDYVNCFHITISVRWQAHRRNFGRFVTNWYNFHCKHTRFFEFLGLLNAFFWQKLGIAIFSCQKSRVPNKI